MKNENNAKGFYYCLVLLFSEDTNPVITCCSQNRYMGWQLFRLIDVNFMFKPVVLIL